MADDEPNANTTLPGEPVIVASDLRPTRVQREHERRRSPQAEAGLVLAGKYRLNRRLGVGGMGEVYEATHLKLQSVVAIKIMHPQVAAVPEYIRRFRREAHAASKLAHRNIVRVMDLGESDGLVYIVMELLSGPTLSDWLDEIKGYPTLAQVHDLMRALIAAFDAAHSAGVVHRDLKPDNIVLTKERDGATVLKVVDFGLAHVDDFRDEGPTLTKRDVVAGTPDYMSPEQCRSLKVGAPTDIYAIGCVLTELLQLRPPFSGKTSIDVLTQHMFAPPPPLLREAGTEPVPELLERLRLDLLDKNPDHRPGISELRTRLEDAFSEDENALRFPGRKEFVAGRSERTPHFPSKPVAPTATRGQVGWIQLATGAADPMSDLAPGLAASGIYLEPCERDADWTRFDAIVLACGDATDTAVTALANIDRTPPTLVCCAPQPADAMRELIAAGASDVLYEPIAVDKLTRKLSRLVRRKR